MGLLKLEWRYLTKLGGNSMSRIQELLEDKTDQIDYEKLIQQHPWVVEKNQNCIVSPDSDGLLCGLLMSHYLDWKIVGFYDGKVLLAKNDIDCKSAIFLDIEIFRKNIKSMGHHMLLYNRNKKPDNWANFKNCVQPNNIRDYDVSKYFRLKYPLATVHMLMGILSSKMKIEVPESAICPLLFTDGTYNVLFKYPENVLNWLNFLRAYEKNNSLKQVFENKTYSVFSLMNAMDEFFRMRDEISIPNQRGDRLRISTPKGEPYNLSKNSDGTYNLDEDAKRRIIKFIELLSSLTGWKYLSNNWMWEDYDLYRFTKKDFSGGGKRLNNKTFNEFIHEEPLSWAATSGQNIEYTLEKPDTLL